MPFALPVLLLVSFSLPYISGNDVINSAEPAHVVPPNRPLTHRNQTKTTRNDQLLSLLASRRREIIQKRFQTHIKNIVDLSSGNTSSPVPSQITNFPNATKTLNVHLNLSDLLLRSAVDNTEEQSANPSTESNVVNVSAPRNAQKRKNVEATSQIPENKTKNMPIIRNILYRRKMSYLNRKLPLDLEQIAYDTLGLSDIKTPEDLILDNEDSLQVEESSHDKLIYYDVKNNASKKTGNNFEDTSDEIKSNKKQINITTTVQPTVVQENMTTTTIKSETKQANNKNTTRFMSTSLYNYFRPLDVPAEEMQPFLRFGDKLPSVKTPRNQSYYKPIEKEKVLEENIATVNNKNEEEIDENMDVSVGKPQIYENKIAKINLPHPKTVARDYFKNRIIQNKKNVTESVTSSPKVDKKTYQHNYRNMTRNRGFRNSTIFVQNKRSGVRHTINLKGNSSIANLKPATTELITNSSVSITTVTPTITTEVTSITNNVTVPEIVLEDKLIKLQNAELTIKIPENQTEVVATVLPEISTQTTRVSMTTESKQTSATEVTTVKTIFTKIPATRTTTARPATVVTTTPRTRKTPTVPTTTEQAKTTGSTTTTTRRTTTMLTSSTTEQTIPTTTSTPSTTEQTIPTTTSTPSTTEQTIPTTLTSTTSDSTTTGIFSTAVVTSVSIESSKSRAANKTEPETKNETTTTTTDINLDFDATVIATLNNFTSQGLQNKTINPTKYPRINLNISDFPTNLTNISLMRQNKKPFILRPTTTEPQTTTSEFIIHVPDIEPQIPETTMIPEVDAPIVKIASRFNYEPPTNTYINISTSTSTTPSTILRIFNTTVLTKPEPEVELPLATLFSVTDFKKPDLTQNSSKTFSKASGSETVISRKSETDVSIDNVHAAYILAALGFLPMMVIVIYVVRSVMKKKPKSMEDYEAEMHDSEKKSIIHPVARLPTLVLDSSNRWEFPRAKLRLQTVLGQGNFGQVWKAEADDLKGHVGLTRLVAVKTIKDGAGTKERDDLLKELGIMQKMGSHPNVVTLLGCCTDKEPYLLIMEYVMYGKLLTFLRDHRTRRDYYNFSDDAATLTARDLTVFAYCVARGMDYLSSKGIIHRDLAARNILVDHNKLCKIADFGMSRDASGAPGGEVTEPRAPRNALPVRWMAVESLLYSVFTHKSDVWAFGVLLWEIVTLGSSPYANMSGREVMRLVCAGYRLERPGHCRPELYGVMARCWVADPESRPTFADLRDDLAALLEQPHPDGSYVDLESFRADPTVYEIDNCTPRGNYFTVKSRFSEFECDI